MRERAERLRAALPAGQRPARSGEGGRHQNGQAPVQRRLAHLQGLADAYVARQQTRAVPGTAVMQAKLTIVDFDDPNTFDAKTKTSELEEIAEYLLEEFGLDFEDAGVGKGDIAGVLRELADSGEHSMRSYEIKDEVLRRAGHVSGGLNDANLLEEAPSENAVTGKGQRIGHRFFPGDDYHLVVKPAIKSGIPTKHLRRLVKDKTATNFDFWIDKDGEIFVGSNGSGGHEHATGYYLTQDDKVIKG